MSTLRRISSVVAIAFVAAIPFIACSDSNSTSAFGENPQAYFEPAPESSSLAVDAEKSGSSSLTIPESSSAIPESSSAVQSSSSDVVSLVNGNKCTAENEGVVDTMWVENIKYGYLGYFRCEKEAWIEKEVSVTCDTTGAKAGDVCTRIKKVGFFGGHESRIVYIYKGNDEWDYFDGLEKMTKECNAANEGLKEKLTYHSVDTNDITVFFVCSHGEWKNTTEAYYECMTEKTALGDTCSIESNGEVQYYRYLFDDGYNSGWAECTFDLEHGYCTKDYSSNFSHHLWDEITPFLYHVSPEGNYYCQYGKWKPAKFVPRQYTDSRKSGLTDEEYDILELPKNAKVGDREGGLLEDCYNDMVMPFGGPSEWIDEMYDYCMPKNYYRYRDNGTWTLETDQERETDPSFHSGQECTAEREGVETVFPPEPHFPGRIYRCISGDNVLEEYIFGRSGNNN